MAQMLFTARHGGTSTGKYSSLNLGDHVGDESIAVANNRRILQNMLSRMEPRVMNQVHGNDVVEVVEDSIAPVTADALITRRPGLPLAVLSADYQNARVGWQRTKRNYRTSDLWRLLRSRYSDVFGCN